MSPRRLGRLLLALALIAPALMARGGQAVDLPAGSCAWFLPLQTNGANALYLDQAVTYWVTRVPYVPGEKLVLRGQYPHARYFSVTAYDARTRALSSLYDAQIQPDPGSANPYQPGADRNTPHRAFSLTANFLTPGQQPSAAPNQLSTGFTGSGAPASDFFLVYRVYLPDQGRDAAGGEPLPSVTAVTALGQSTFPACPAGYQPPAAVNQAIAESGSPAPLPSVPGAAQPKWHKFYNLATSAANGADSTGKTNFAGTVTPYTMKTGSGGYLEDLENAYLYTFLNAPSGPLVVIQAQALSYPNTYAGAPTMPGPTDVRYWSICSYDPVSQRNYACTPDFRTAPQLGGYTVVVSTPANKPADLCGATWLPFGPAAQSLLIFRNQLGVSPYSVQNVQVGQETAMGAYYPAARYLDQAGYRRQVCGIDESATPPADQPTDYGQGAAFDGFGAFGDYGGLGFDAGAGAMDPGDQAPADTADTSGDQQGAVLAAHAARPPLRSGNLPLGLALAALFVGLGAVSVRRKLAG
ncbi:MAG TPA: hypothetical protein VF160_10610 [Candidatus Dormibacteraeota bacterium]